MMSGENKYLVISADGLFCASVQFWHFNGDISQRDNSRTQFAEYQFKDDALPDCPESQLAAVNMINYVVDEIKYKIPDILCKHKNLALSSPAMKSLMTCQGWCVLVADRKKLLPGEVDLYCGRQRGGENVTETKWNVNTNTQSGRRRHGPLLPNIFQFGV